MYEEFYGGNNQKSPFRNTDDTYGISSPPILATLFMKKLQMTSRNYIQGLPKYFTMISMLIY